MLRLENITKDYKVADTTVAALRGIDLAFRKKRIRIRAGTVGLRQNHAAQHNRRFGQIHVGRNVHKRKEHPTFQRRRLGRIPQPQDRLCVSKLQFNPPPNGIGQRRAGFNHSGRRQSRAHETCQARVGQGGFGRSVQQKAKSAFGRTMPTRGYCPRFGQRTRYFACRRTDGRA